MARMKQQAVTGLGDGDLLRQTGQALYGERFQTLLAKDLGLPTGFLSEILNNKKLLPARHRTTLANLCHQWLMALPEKTAAVEAFGKAWRERRYT